MELDSSFIHYLYHCLFTSIDIVEMVLTIIIIIIMFLWVKVGISPGVSGQ